MKKDKCFLFFVIGLLAWSMVGCTDDTPTVLTSQERQLVDSIYKRRLPSLRKKTDSLCDEQNEKLVQYFSDSLKTAYIEGIHEIQEYLEYGEDEE